MYRLFEELAALLRQVNWTDVEMVAQYERTIEAHVPTTLTRLPVQAPRYPTLRAYVNAQPRGAKLVDIAGDLGIPASTLAGYLGGFSVPRRSVALRLARAYRIDLEGLLDPPDVPRRPAPGRVDAQEQQEQ